MQLVSLFAAEKIEPAGAETNRFLDDSEHELHTWTQEGELRIESLQIAVHRLMVKKGIVHGNRAVIHPHTVESQKT